MLEVEINNQNVDLDDDTAIAIEYHNQILSKQGTFSFPFTIPATQRNLSLLNSPHRLDVQRVGYLPSEFGFRATWKTTQILAGTATVKKTSIVRSKPRIELYVIAEKGAFFDRFRNKLLPDVPMDRMEFANTAAYDTYLNEVKDFVYPARNFAMFPINAPDLFKGSYKENEWNTKIKHINRYVPQSVSTGQFYGYRIPQLYLDYVVKKIIAHAGYSSIDSNRYTYVWMYNAVIECQRYLDMQQLGASGSTDYLKCYTDAYTTNGDQPSFDLEHFLPDYNVRDFLIELERKYGLRFIVDDRTREVRVVQYGELANTTLYDAQSINVAYAYEIEATPEQAGVKMSYSFDADTLTDSIRNRDEFYLSQIVNTVADLPASVADDKFPFYYVVDKNAYYQYDNVANAWKFAFYEMCNYTTNADGYDLDGLEISSLVMKHWDSDAGTNTPINIPSWTPSRKVWLPTTYQNIFKQSDDLLNPASTNTILTREMYAKNKPRILWYCGMHPDARGNNYPLATSTPYNGNGTPITNMPNSESLYTPDNSSKSLYNKYHKDFVEWWQRCINVKLQPIFSFQELICLDLTKPYWCERLQSYIVFIKIPVQFTKHQIKIGQAEAVKYAED